MKPRLEPVDWTPEDNDAFLVRLLRVAQKSRSERRVVLLAHTLGAFHDARDADVMLKLTRVQVRESIDNQTWVNGGPDGDLVPVRPAALWVIE